MLARSTGGAFTQAGGSTWFFVTAGYAFGRQLEADTTQPGHRRRRPDRGRGRLPISRHHRFTPVLRQAQQSGAAVLGLANAGADVTACVRGAAAMGLTGQMRLACLLMQLPDVRRLGLDLAGGLILTESFYWDLNDRTRAFTGRLMTQEKPAAYPDMIQAGCYAGALHYLKAVAAMDLAAARRDGAAVVTRMKAAPTDDDAFGRARIRQDGRAMVPAYLFQVKTEGESSGDWDLYRLLTSTDAEEAYGPMSNCTLAAAERRIPRTDDGLPTPAQTRPQQPRDHAHQPGLRHDPGGRRDHGGQRQALACLLHAGVAHPSRLLRHRIVDLARGQEPKGARQNQIDGEDDRCGQQRRQAAPLLQRLDRQQVQQDQHRNGEHCRHHAEHRVAHGDGQQPAQQQDFRLEGDAGKADCAHVTGPTS